MKVQGTRYKVPSHRVPRSKVRVEGQGRRFQGRRYWVEGTGSKVLYKVEGTMYKVQGRRYKGTRYKVQGTRYKVQGTRYKVQGTRYKVQGTKYKVQGTRYKVQGTRYKVQGTRCRALKTQPEQASRYLLGLHNRIAGRLVSELQLGELYGLLERSRPREPASAP